MASAGLAARLATRGTAQRRAYSAARFDGTPVPTARQRHMLSRMGCGFSVASFKQLRKAGGELEWFERQLEPASITEPALAEAVISWFPTMQHDPMTIWNNDQNDVRQNWEYARDLCNYSLLRRIYSNRTVFESMVEFWSNHLHVEAGSFPAFTQRPAYDATIRQHALGTFEELLVAAALHPAMLMYLDNWKSVKNAPNENQGRELLELHTVGRDSGYTEAMVKDSAKILSGHTVVDRAWHAVYDPNRHTTGPVTVLEFSHPNAVADDQLAVEYLRFLARHPATARRIARKLAVRFVSDNPSDYLVEHLATVFQESGTDIKATLRALVRTDEFWASAGQKVRTPIDDVVATCRVLRMKVKAPTGTSSFAHALGWTINSTLIYQWPRPDGPPDRAGTWASTTRMLNSWQMHWGMAGGWWPKEQSKYRAPKTYLPAKSLRFDAFVDHLSRVVLGRPSTDLLLKAACEGCDIAPGEVVNKRHAALSWKFPRLLAVLLDSPAHMTR
jgi:uncharacterized protein (DUF1800 family)